MSLRQKSWPAARIGRGVASVLAALAIGIFTAGAQAEDASKILKAMSDYVANEKNISISFDTDVEVVTSDLQKIQFSSSGQALLSRPDKLRVTRTGGYTDVDVVFDGKTVSIRASTSIHMPRKMRPARLTSSSKPSAIATTSRCQAPTCCSRVSTMS